MDLSLSPADRYFLSRAIELGNRGWAGAHPNPMVGCVLVKDGEVLAEGWHQEFGGPHAEAVALAEAGEAAEGCVAYVSLEPCDHTGKTPPCSRALLKAGVNRVLYGAQDPGRESGGGADTLRRGGVEVVGPCLTSEEARRHNAAFFWNQEHGTPFVAIKLAQTLDGKIAEAPGRRTAITGPEAQEETHRLRAGFDAVLVGSTTALVDNPFLTVRKGIRPRKQPWRIVMDSEGRISPGANLFLDLPDAGLMVFTGEDLREDSLRPLQEAGARAHRVPKAGDGLSIPAVLKACWELGIRSVFCEGGGTLAASLIRQGFAGRIYLFVAPFVLGDGGVPAFPGLQSREAWDGWTPSSGGSRFGRDLLLTFDRKK